MRNLLISVLLVNPVWTWLHRLGGPGLILLGLADNSLIPLPGSVDVFVILLAAHRREWWPYYAFMATVGAVIGGYLTYRLAEKGGEETLERRVGKQQAQKVYKRFAKRGFITVFIGSILPPPFPMVPFLMAAGVLQYPRQKFLSALSAGRGGALLRAGLGSARIWQSHRHRAVAVLPARALWIDCIGGGGRCGRAGVFQMVPAESAAAGTAAGGESGGVSGAAMEAEGVGAPEGVKTAFGSWYLAFSRLINGGGLHNPARA
jgi:membrane protein YqaA with SNARE-associated domain